MTHMFIQERVDSIPFLIKICHQLKINETIDVHLPQHGNMKRISYGQVAVGWISFILSNSSHCKSHVENWAGSIIETLKLMLGEKVLEKDFSDDRLSQLLYHLSNNNLWHDLEMAMWKAKIDVYEFSDTRIVRLDSTASCGHHIIDEDGIMQLGKTKDFRPDLPQLKLMVAAEGNTGDVIAVDVVPGNMADDPLYVPLIERVYLILNQHGLLFCGDCKMSSLDTRGYIAKHQDYYLTPLQLCTEKLRQNLEEWVNRAVDGDQQLLLVFRQNKLIAAGYETTRSQKIGDFEWTERLLLVKSMQWSQCQIDGLEKRISSAINKIDQLHSKIKSKKYNTKTELKKVVDGILKNHDVQDLLRVTYKKVESNKTFKRTEIRNGKKRNGAYTISKVYYVVDRVKTRVDMIESEKRRTGWRIYATNSPLDKLTFEGAILCYRDEHIIEQQMHFLKGQPIGIRPLFVRNKEQLIGLSRFLTIALRIWTYLRTRTTLELKKEKKDLSDVYKGVPTKKTKSPTGKIIIEAFDNTTLIWSKKRGQVTVLSKNAQLLLRYFGLSPSLYSDLSKKKSCV